MDNHSADHAGVTLSRRALLGAGLAAAAFPGVAQAALVPPGWQSFGFPFLRGNEFSGAPDDVIEIRGVRASSVLVRPLNIDLARTPRLSWRWRVDAGPPATELAVRGADDRAIALIIGFAFDEANASEAERREYRRGRFWLGARAPGRTLHYIWGSGAARGSVIRPARAQSARFVILRPATEAAATWRLESVNVAEDYARVFGSPPPRAIQMAIASDGDDSRSTVRAAIGDFAWR